MNTRPRASNEEARGLLVGARDMGPRLEEMADGASDRCRLSGTPGPVSREVRGAASRVEQDHDLAALDLAHDVPDALFERALANPVVGAVARDELLEEPAQRVCAERPPRDLDGFLVRVVFGHPGRVGRPRLGVKADRWRRGRRAGAEADRDPRPARACLNSRGGAA